MVRRVALGALSALGAIACGLALARSADAHALHVSYADVAVERGAARVALRVYTDDLLRAAGAPARVDGYVRAHFALADRAGRAVPLAPCGSAVRGDMTHLCLQGALPAGSLGGVRLTDDILHAQYTDQINVVRVAAGRTVLFTRSRPVQGL